MILRFVTPWKLDSVKKKRFNSFYQHKLVFNLTDDHKFDEREQSITLTPMQFDAYFTECKKKYIRIVSRRN